MKKIFLIFGFCAMPGMLSAATNPLNWWQQPTICKPNTTNCYASMGAGFDAGMWDASGNCWGMKLVCPNAVTVTGNEPIPMGRVDLAGGRNIREDFDISVLDGDCFGTRKTRANGSQASVNGKWVTVWCPGILDIVDETLITGEITFDNQPTCRDLAKNGYANVLDKKCFGKYYEPMDYYIECTNNTEYPNRLIVLNGAYPVTGTGIGTIKYPTTESAANEIFDMMQSVSAVARNNN